MTLFWLAASAMIGAALLFILPPLLWPLRSSRWTAVAVGLFLPVFAIGWYWQFGPGEHVFKENRFVHPRVETRPANRKVGSVQSMVTGLEQRLEKHPDDAKGWILLARSYEHLNENDKAGAAYARASELGFDVASMELQNALRKSSAIEAAAENAETNSSHDIDEALVRLRARLKVEPEDASAWALLGRSYQRTSRYEEASRAFREAAHLAPGEAQLWADYADAAAMSKGKQLAGHPAQAVRKALELDPENRKALWLAGTHAMQQGDFAGSLDYWRKLERITPEDSPDRPVIAANIRDAEEGSLSRVSSVPKADVSQALAGVEPAEIRGVLNVDPALADKVADNDTVFIFARAAEGPRAPLAVVRKKAEDLPISFVLNDEMAMTPAFRLSNFSEVVVGARISRSGNATPQAGDLTGTSQVIEVGTQKPVLLVIREQEPGLARLR